MNKTFLLLQILMKSDFPKQSYELICDRGCPEFLMYFLYFSFFCILLCSAFSKNHVSSEIPPRGTWFFSKVFEVKTSNWTECC